MRIYTYLVLILLFGIIACQNPPENLTWKLSETIILDGVNPIGMALSEKGLWLSDGDHNRVVEINQDGTILRSIDSLDRPMHISVSNGSLFIPQYGNDLILHYQNDSQSVMTLTDSLDAPAGISVNGDAVAIADFYNHRILYSADGNQWISIGKEGKAAGEFYYPTDVQITEEHIWVADAYNNRVQLFDRQGKHLDTFGEEQKMNAATGLFVATDAFFVTDFENDRVLVFDLNGSLKQVLTEQIQKPTDMLLLDDQLLIANYKGSTLLKYSLVEDAAN